MNSQIHLMSTSVQTMIPLVRAMPSAEMLDAIVSLKTSLADEAWSRKERYLD